MLYGSIKVTKVVHVLLYIPPNKNVFLPCVWVLACSGGVAAPLLCKQVRWSAAATVSNSYYLTKFVIIKTVCAAVVGPCH